MNLLAALKEQTQVKNIQQIVVLIVTFESLLGKSHFDAFITEENAWVALDNGENTVCVADNGDNTVHGFIGGKHARCVENVKIDNSKSKKECPFGLNNNRDAGCHSEQNGNDYVILNNDGGNGRNFGNNKKVRVRVPKNVKNA